MLIDQVMVYDFEPRIFHLFLVLRQQETLCPGHPVFIPCPFLRLQS